MKGLLKLFQKHYYLFHPFLFSIYPIIYLYRVNAGYLGFTAIIKPIIISLLAAFFCFRLFSRMIKNDFKASLLTTLFLLVFFSYGHVQSVLLNKGLLIGLNRYLIFLNISLVIIIGTAIVKTGRNIHFLNQFLNWMAVSLIVVVFTNISQFYFQSKKHQNNFFLPTGDTDKAILTIPPNPPDIYYIVLDGYMRSDLLKEIFSYDNSSFSQFLKETGFFTATKSTSNYPYTMLSLASSLNMNYVNSIEDQAVSAQPDYTLIFPLIYSNQVGRLLKSAGYRFVQVGSWWDGTNKSLTAETVLTWRQGKHNEDFIQLLLKTTIFYALTGGDANTLQIENSRQASLFEFKEVPHIAGQNQPTFVLAHIILPHPPYVFGSNGDMVIPPETGWTSDTSQKAYLNQLIFLNTKLEGLVNDILRNSRVPPIIVIQSDHGWAWAVGWDLYPQKTISDKFDFRQIFGIFNAYYLPGVSKSLLYDAITPVNTFRLIFNAYFGTNLPMLQDRNFFSDYYKSPYKFINVTEDVQKNK